MVLVYWNFGIVIERTKELGRNLMRNRNEGCYSLFLIVDRINRIYRIFEIKVLSNFVKY
jgi:hypothetical protein